MYQKTNIARKAHPLYRKPETITSIIYKISNKYIVSVVKQMYLIVRIYVVSTYRLEVWFGSLPNYGLLTKCQWITLITIRAIHWNLDISVWCLLVVVDYRPIIGAPLLKSFNSAANYKYIKMLQLGFIL